MKWLILLLLSLSNGIASSQTPAPSQLTFHQISWSTAVIDSQRWYYDNGRLEVLNRLSGDTLWRFEYYPDGTLALKAVIEQDLRFDTVYTISPVTYLDTMILDTGYYDSRVGDYIEYHQDGQLKLSGQCAHDEMHGRWKEWYASGQLKCVYSMSNDHYTKRMKAYHPNGQLAVKGGTSVRTWKEWDENGALIKKEKFPNQRKG